jgi:hypothetical protein
MEKTLIGWLPLPSCECSSNRRKGRVLLAAREADCQATYEALRGEPDFYSGDIVLSAFLEARSHSIGLRHLLYWNRQTNAFLYHEESGRAEVINPRP